MILEFHRQALKISAIARQLGTNSPPIYQTGGVFAAHWRPPIEGTGAPTPAIGRYPQPDPVVITLAADLVRAIENVIDFKLTSKFLGISASF